MTMWVCTHTPYPTTWVYTPNPDPPWGYGYGLGYQTADPYPYPMISIPMTHHGYVIPMQLPIWNHTPSSAIGPANALSCKDVVDTSEDNSFQVLLPHLQINMLNTTLTKKILESTPFNQFVIDALATLNVETVPLPHS